jgi:small subunit ribosomal protein S5
MADQRRNQGNRGGREQEKSPFDEKVVQISRVSKKTKGGNKMGFAVLMVVGDRQGQVGVGLGKAADVLSAIRKGVRKARKKMFVVPMDGTTVPFRIEIKRGAARIVISPAARGSGVIAGGPVRAVVEAAGIRDISAKILGTSNKASNVHATFEALQEIRRLVDIRGISLKSVAEEEREQQALEREVQREAKAKAEESAAQAAAEAEPKTKKPAVKRAAAPKKAEKPTEEKKAEVKVEAKPEAKVEAAPVEKTEAAVEPKAEKPAAKKAAAKPAKKAAKKE